MNISSFKGRKNGGSFDFGQFFHLSLDMFCIAGYDGYFKMLNSKWEDVLGFTLEELQAVPFIRFIHPEDKSRTIIEAVRLATGGGTVSFHNRCRKKDGSYAWFRWRATSAHNLFYATAIDMTAELKRNELIRRTNEVARVGGWEYNATKNHLAWTDEAYRINGVPLGHPITLEKNVGLYRESERPLLLNYFERLIHHREQFTCVVPLAEKDPEIYIQIHGFEKKTESGDIYIFGLFQDVTERRKAELERDENNVRLLSASKLSAIGEMSAGIAHEINNPMSVISGFADTLVRRSDQPLKPEKVKDIGKKIGKMIDRISRIVRSMKNLSRDASGDTLQKTSVSSIIDESLDICSERLKDLGIQLHLPENSDQIFIFCRPVEISQILLNLLTNAVDAIQTHAKTDKEHWIQVDAKNENKFIEIGVTNGGPPIPERIRSQILNPFFTTKVDGKGTGLGLSISKNIMKAHQGEFFLDEQSKNTRFVMRFQTKPRF